MNCFNCGKEVKTEGRIVCPNCDDIIRGKSEYIAIIGLCGREIKVSLGADGTEAILDLFKEKIDKGYFVADNGEHCAIKGNKLDYVIFKKREVGKLCRE